MDIYRLTICEIICYQYENTLHEWFLTEEEMKAYKDKYEKNTAEKTESIFQISQIFHITRIK